MERKPKRKKRYFSSNLMAKKKRDLFLKIGLKGFICTCNGNEKQCIRESYNILNEYADKLYGEDVTYQFNPNKGDNEKPSEEEEDEMDAYKKEVEMLKSQNVGNAKRFQARDTGIQNCIFIETKLDDPAGLMHVIMKDLFETKQKKARFLLRMVPLDVTCKANMDDLEKAAGPLFDAHFTAEPTTYAVVYTKRCNSNLDRDTVIKKLASMVQKRNGDHKVNLGNPTTTILVEVIKSICGLAVIRDYFQFCKYNLHNVCFDPNSPAEIESGKCLDELTSGNVDPGEIADGPNDQENDDVEIVEEPSKEDENMNDT